MANKSVGIHVTGIPELSSAFRAVDRDLSRQLRTGMAGIAKRVVKVAEGKGAPSGMLRTRAGMKGAGIAFPAGGSDSRNDPRGFYPWLDFGGGRREGRGVTPSGDRRGVRPGGRYLYPAIGESRDFMAEEVLELVEKVAEDHRFKVRG